MELITIRSQILEVADRWREQYAMRYADDLDKMKILRELEKLDKETATAKDVENIIGNTSWACKQECRECKKDYDSIVELGDLPYYESSTTWICLKCLKKAIELFDEPKSLPHPTKSALVVDENEGKSKAR